MRIEKKALANLARCYATAAFPIDGEPTILLATEGEGACLSWRGPDFKQQRSVWDGPGGTMSIVPIPGKNGEFLAIQKFFKLFQWDEAIVVWVKPQADGSFESREILKLPYIHRFDLFECDGRVLFLGCTLAESKETRDDWSKAGKVYVGQLAKDWDSRLELRVIKDGLFRNHGYARSTWKGREAGLITSDEGAFAVTPPAAAGDDWSVERFMDWQISDIAACDIDGDGELEYATIEPWHGGYFRVYKRIGGKYLRIWEHPEIAEFYHVVVGTRLRNIPTFIGGCRRGSQHLFLVQAAAPDAAGLPSLTAVTIDTGVGPSNVAVLNGPDRDIIISANREKGEAALYFITD